MTDTNWRLTVERVQTIYQSAEDTQCARAELLPNGNITLTFSIGNHWASDQKVLISRDRGKTWEKPGPGGEILTGFVCVLADGTVMALEAVAVGKGDETSESNPRLKLKWSNDDGNTFQQKLVPVQIPQGVKFYGPEGLVELPDENLLCPYYGHRPGQAKYHTGLIRSTDRGETWFYDGDIAYDADAPDSGFCEPYMICLANGDLLIMLRTGSASPMYQARSTDGGKTWSKPQQVMDHGVAPYMCLMQNGVLVCSYGRPNSGIMFSYDGTGHEWEDAQDLYRAEGSHYTTVFEIEPNLLMYFYDQSSFCLYETSPGPLNEVRVAFVRIESDN